MYLQLLGCQNCGALKGAGDKPLLVCARCNIAAYCSKRCQKEHYPEHKALCKKPKAAGGSSGAASGSSSGAAVGGRREAAAAAAAPSGEGGATAAQLPAAESASEGTGPAAAAAEVSSLGKSVQQLAL
jgi:MYND finger